MIGDALAVVARDVDGHILGFGHGHGIRNEPDAGPRHARGGSLGRMT
jgi:hypothetical protein